MISRDELVSTRSNDEDVAVEYSTCYNTMRKRITSGTSWFPPYVATRLAILASMIGRSKGEN
ncbi:hypothetical protein M404DRAFT_995458 [Pisolithus tinctorius Marx 270]|uniref:Uncharacterized protein n=1 Tax=Pisolithus tinctorius Marx 270 TaxID=870435 RepID=A0A0C3KKY2_PISTI|nr:hypothetical protein M404DRAFT_995458 [Pisolithus tinctorius Marx 270]